MAARELIPATTINTGYQQTPDLMTFTATHATNKNYCLFTGRQVLIFRNTGATPRLVTVSSVADDEGRTGDLTQTVGAGEMYVTQMFPTKGWIQTDGTLYFEAAHSDITVCVLTLP